MTYTQEQNTAYQRQRCADDPGYREKRRQATKAWKVRHLAKIEAIIAKAKAVPCVDCGNQYPPVAMDFDHVRGIKSFPLSKAGRSNKTVEEILAEIAKCEVRCAVCHRLRTWPEQEMG